MSSAIAVRRAMRASFLMPLLLLACGAQARDEVKSRQRADVQDAAVTDVRIQFDNDLLAPSNRDRDYTGGLGVTVSGTAARDSFLSLDPLLGALDGLAQPASANSSLRFARQGGMLFFTPTDITISQPQPGERPYASLLFTSNGRMRVDADDRGAWSSSFTIGLLGLPMAESVHHAVHKLTGADKPEGYDHQISSGGEPTARYTLARHKLWLANASNTIDVKTTMQGSIGYLTEASAGISMRIGRFDTPWWSFAPELTDYMAAPVPVESRHTQSELYFFAGARLKARGYDAFLQGQFRHSDVRYSSDEIEPLLAEGWIGVVAQVADQLQMSYALRYQTAELQNCDGSRGHWWGSLQLAHSF